MATELINSASDEYVHSLLSSDSNIGYEIPKYQREYSWGQWQWEELIQDLQEEPAGQGHFLGTIICINTTTDALHPRLELVDGQQRLTTLSILLVALYSHLSDHTALIQADDEHQQKFFNLRTRLVKSNTPRLRLQRQGNNDADYRWLLIDAKLLKDPDVGGAPSWWGIRRIAKAYRYFRSVLATQLSDIDDTAAKVGHLLDMLDRVANSVLVKLEVKNHASAFTLFESLNNRGLELTPIDLIKNSMLMRADKHVHATDPNVDEAYGRWTTILTDLGPSATEQERFLRYYYNAFEPVPKESAASPIATRTNLIRLYEEFLDLGVGPFLNQLAVAAHEYGRIIDTIEDDDEGGALDRATTRLQRAQGAQGNALLMYLLVRRHGLGLTDADITRVADLLTSFFVRRNVTSLPATYELASMFKSIVRGISGLRGDDVVTHIRTALRARSSDDEMFRRALSGAIYVENVDMTRFVLAALAERAQTLESNIDLWERMQGERARYVWTIEHIFPQGENIPASWVTMMGGADAARRAHEEHVHRLGNLTLTGYNSTLGNKSFVEKRDRVDVHGRPVGYRNGLVLNDDLKDADAWSVAQITARTGTLVDQVLGLFPLP